MCLTCGAVLNAFASVTECERCELARLRAHNAVLKAKLREAEEVPGLISEDELAAMDTIITSKNVWYSLGPGDMRNIAEQLLGEVRRLRPAKGGR